MIFTRFFPVAPHWVSKYAKIVTLTRLVSRLMFLERCYSERPELVGREMFTNSEQGLIGLPYVFWFGTGQCRCSSKVPSRLPTLSLVEGRKRTDTSLIPMGLDCVCGRCGHWNKLGENYYMKKEKERENCPSQGGISSKINSCQGGRLKSDSDV